MVVHIYNLLVTYSAIAFDRTMVVTMVPKCSSHALGI